MIVQNLAFLILRIVFGLIFLGHGTQKLFGWFGGGGISGTAKMVTHIGINPPKFWAWIAGLSEALGGLGLMFGFLTPLASALIVGDMLMAIIKVHWQNGFWNSKRGFEFPMLNAFLAAFLGIAGPGAYAMDALLGFDRSSLVTFLLSMILVLLGMGISQISGQVVEQGPSNQRPQHG